MTAPSSLQYGFTSSRDLHAKLSRERQSLREAITTQRDVAIADAILNFSVTGHSLKDWIKHEDSSLSSTVESFITNTPVLAACADICNSSKHKMLTNGIRAHSTGDIRNSELTMDMTTISSDSTIPINGHTVRILFDDGSQMEILHFVNQVHDEWQSFLDNNGL